MYGNRPRTRRHGFAAVLLGLALAFAAPAGAAGAHAAPLHTAPPAGSVLDKAPAEVVIRFTEHVRPVADQVRVTGPGGVRGDTGQTPPSGQNLVIRLRDGLPNGTYLVSYRVVSADGHPVEGGFSFSIGTVTATAATRTSGRGDARVDPTVAVALPALHYVGFAGLILLVGPLLLLAGLWPARLSRRGPGRLAAAGAALLAAGTAGELLLLGPYATGGRLTSVSAADLVDAADSRVGLALLARLTAVVLAVPLLVFAVRRASSRAYLPLGLLGAAASVTWPLAGHTGGSFLTLVADAVHVAAMACWLGGLVVLLAFLLRRGRREELAAILPVWSRWALVLVAALGTAGLVQAVVEVGTPAALIHTRYGWLLLAKVGVFAVILGAAAVARSTVRRSAGHRLTRAVATELTLAAVVLALTAVLVQEVPARTAEALAQPPYTVTLANKLYRLHIRIAPARVGDNSVDLVATGPDGRPLKVLEWFASATLPSRGIAPVSLQLRQVGDDRATAAVALPVPGAWKFRFALRVTDIDQASVTGTVPVR